MCKPTVHAVQSHFRNDRLWQTLPQENLVECSLVIFTLPSEFSCLAQPSLQTTFLNVKLEIDYRRLLPGGPSSSEGSTVGPTVLSLAIFNNLVLTMSSQIGITLAKRGMQKTREPTLLFAEYTISTPSSSRQPTR